MEKIIAGATVQVNDEGYLTDHHQWNREIANEIAEEEGIELTERHFEVITFIQDQYAAEVPLTIRKIGKSGIVDIKEFYQLFPNGPLKKASRIAGIPKPVSCI
ncbi:TusE/DsrC/DsvC family sulfur relay protein [Fulvivirgaceae bacterium BMA10]|uniref:TusE/DsrC/DsvC family sulfur relay protein n=1 Tax=Splendidivirga corallicola TaxID=3051826 RepID=A0ABT8KWX3_9BACT|nr:TusE/DsrC/DsvC family sulfur relay protein [Fulvivirgaceae bacterium BMA10]